MKKFVHWFTSFKKDFLRYLLYFIKAGAVKNFFKNLIINLKKKAAEVFKWRLI